ncbi:MAG: AMP-binding protein, partial [Ilumatobacter sp.]|nr:AMP-binding protein [Ilumatobacter sp.]
MAVLTSGFAAEKGDQLALADDTQTRTWAEFDERVNRLIHSLRDAGVEAGDTIAVLSGNCNEWFETAFACANAGIVFVPVNWHLVASEIAYILGDSDSKAVIVGHHFVNEMFKALDDERCSAIELALVIGAPSDGRFQNFDDFLAAGSPEEPENQSFGGPMFYTSGTTGHPKGVRGSLTNMPEGADPTIWQLIGAGFAEQAALMTVGYGAAEGRRVSWFSALRFVG